jgi:DNA ligase-associated metallophosphoesterase
MTIFSKIKADRAATRIKIAGEEVLCDSSGALFMARDGVIVVSDLHFEKGSSYARRGSFLPPYETAETLRRLEAVIDFYRPSAVISLGDSFHDDGGSARMPEIYRQKLLALMTGREWFWVSGNHDPAPPEGLPGQCVDELALGDLVFRHMPAGKEEGEIAGHLHPGARIVQRGRSVRRACFASDGVRLVMPAFGSLTGTLNVLDRAFSGLFRREHLVAYMLGQNRIYPIASGLLRA